MTASCDIVNNERDTYEKNSNTDAAAKTSEISPSSSKNDDFSVKSEEKPKEILRTGIFQYEGELSGIVVRSPKWFLQWLHSPETTPHERESESESERRS